MTREGFHRQVLALQQATILLGEQAATAVRQAVQAFTVQDAGLARKIEAEDAGINRMEQQILEDATQLLNLQAPVASDLRRILGISRVAHQFERIGDHARDIARNTLQLVGAPPLKDSIGFSLLIDAVLLMLQDGLRCHAEDNIELARAVGAMDDQVDDAYAAVFRALLGEMATDTSSATYAAYTLFAARSLERIGDHLTNVAETVIYVVTGVAEEFD